MGSRALAIALVLGTALSAAAHHLGEPEGFEKVLGAADHDFDRRKYDEALAGFRTALGMATRVDNQVYVEFRVAQALQRLGKFQEARTALQALIKAHPQHDKTPRALYLAARIRERDLSDPKGAEKEYFALMRRFPTSDAAARALQRIALLYTDRDVGSAIDVLRDIYRKYQPGPLAPRAAYLGAKLFEEKNQPDDALALYELIIRKYPKSGLYDDALWKGAAILRKAKRPREALRLYHALTDTRRESWNIGSYNSIYLDRAALEKARVWLDELGDIQKGIDALRDFVANYPHSMKRIEARKLLVGALLKAGKRGDARRELEELKRLHPKSKHTREATALFQGKQT